MVYLTVPAVAFALCALNALHAGAAPIENRAEDVLSTCNNARLGVISGLNSSTNDIEALLQAVGNNDPATTSSANQALTGVRACQGGVATIVKGVLAGVTPDASGVPAIAQGLIDAASAVGQIKSNDSNVQSMVATILNDLNNTKSVGDVAISECAKLSSNSSSSSSSNSSSSDNSSNSTSDSSQNQQVVTQTVTVTDFATKTVNGGASIQTQSDGRIVVTKFGRRASGASSCSSSSASVVSAFNQAVSDIQTLQKAAGNDNATSSAAQTAASALSDASKAVAQIQSKNGASSAANTIGSAIQTAQDSINSINSTDSSVNSALSTVEPDLINILSTAQHLAIDCTPTAGGVSPGKRRRGLGAMIWG